MITLTFQNDEIITDAHTGSATINGTLSTPSNFPVLLTFNSSHTDFWTHCDAETEIVITASDGATKLKREVEKFDHTADNLNLWFKAPTLSSSVDTEFYIYYGNDSGSESDDVEVWDSGFVMVQHLEEIDIDGGSGDIKDSTGNGNDGTTAGMNGDDQVAGKIDGSLDFEGDGDWVKIPDSSSLHLSDFTISLWFYSDGWNTGINQNIVSKRDAYNTLDWQFYYNNGAGEIQGYIGESQDDSIFSSLDYTPTINIWHNIVITKSGTIYEMFEDSNSKGTDTSVSIWTDSDDIHIGSGYNGQIDEVRISNTARSAEWIETEYNNQSDVADFLTFNSAETTLPCAGTGSICKTNACSTYLDCSTLIGACDTGNCCSGTCTTDTEDPTISTNLSATAISTTEIDLTWTVSTDNVGITGYKIYRDTVEIDTSATNSYSDTGLTQGALYTYTVSAYDGNGNEGEQSTTATATTWVENVYYISPIGTALWSECLNISTPCSLDTANTNAIAGDTVYLRGGTYIVIESAISPVNSGTSVNSMITYSGYESEAVTIMGATDVTGLHSEGLALYNDSYIKVTKIIFTNLYRGFRIHEGDHNEISYCEFTFRDPWADIQLTGTAKNDADHYYQSATTLYDTENDLSGYNYRRVYNVTDKSTMYSIDSATSVTLFGHNSRHLLGGTDNYWEYGDIYQITLTYPYDAAVCDIGGTSTHNYIHHNSMHGTGGFLEGQDGVPVFQIGPDVGGAEYNNNNTIEYNHIYHGGHHVLGMNKGLYNVLRHNYIHNEAWFDDSNYSGNCYNKGLCGYTDCLKTPLLNFSFSFIFKQNMV